MKNSIELAGLFFTIIKYECIELDNRDSYSKSGKAGFF